jgi:superfamily II DNA/RNA helicase
MAQATTPTRARASTFADLGLPDQFVATLRRGGIDAPLPIQAMAIPDALEGRDVSGKAPTGSGKTLAFSLPMTAMLSRGRPRRPTGLVLAPTRELASQIATTIAPFAKLKGLHVHAFYGGVGYGPQIKALQRGVDIVVACPGRLEDLLASGHLSLAEVEMVVVDEADRMADMGFLPAVRRLLDATQSDRQTLLFSATLDGDVDVLVKRYQNDPVRHEAESDDEDLSRMTHRFMDVAHDQRVTTVAQVIATAGSTVVFVRTKHGADRLAKQLGKSGVSAVAIHGDRSQAQRERALRAFSAGSSQTLVATDVAARGIHVDEVACVIHFDLPADAKDYVHRSGRTARAGADGLVVTLVTPENRAAANQLRRTLGFDGAPPARDTQASGTAASPARGANRGRRGRSPRGRSRG